MELEETKDIVEESKHSNEREKLYFIVPIIFVCAIVPLIVYLRIIPLSKEVGDMWVNSKFDADFFSYYKAMLLLSCTLLIIVFTIFAAAVKRRGISKTWVYLPASVYLALIILSTAMSQHLEVALLGFPSRYEGALVNIAYLIVMFAAINLVRDDKQIKIVVGSILFSATLIGIIGVLQFFGLDIFKSEIGKYLIVPPDMHKLNLNFSFGKYTIYSTLFNTNNVGSYAALLFPLSFSLYVLSQRTSRKILAGIFTCLMFMVWIGCLSRAGIMGGIAALLVLFILLFKKVTGQYKKIIIIFAAYGILAFVMNWASGGNIWNTADRVAGELKGVSGPVIKNIVLDKESITLQTANTSLKVLLDVNQLKFLDSESGQLEFEQIPQEEGTQFSFRNDKYKDCKVRFYSQDNLLTMDISGTQVNLVLTEQGIMFVGSKNRVMPQGNIRKVDIQGHEDFASGRGFIWSRSVPLLADNLLIGKGPDTFPFYFPQDDFTGKLLGLNNQAILVDKPHNMYLHIGIGTGGVSLAAFLILMSMYLVTGLRLLFRPKGDELEVCLGTGIFAAVTGYLVAGIFNDSIVSVAPVFWVLLGLGVNINLKLKAREKGANAVSEEILQQWQPTKESSLL